MKPRLTALFWLALSALLLASRLCHARVLWADEDYHLAAAIQALHGKMPYRDFWYDKPPLNLAFYLAFGARTGAVLRIAGAIFDVLCCALAYRFASRLWSRREGLWASALLAFSLVFYFAPGVMPMEPDTLMLAPHIAAVYLAWRGRAFAAGLAAGVAFLLNVKGAFVLAACFLFAPSPWLLVGFLAPQAIVLAASGDYFEQVWRWGLLYARGGPASGGLLSWLGFHAALVIAAAWYWWRERRPERLALLGWVALSAAAAALGWRFAPRYFMQVLPALVIPASRGFRIVFESNRFAAAALAVVLAIPAVRFGPRYISLARGEPWQDTALDRDSQEAARVVTGMSKPGDTIFIWGYRPDVIAYTRLPVAGKFWDSQPLTGVPADRHLSDSRPMAASEWTAHNRREAAESHPTFIVDGLSLLNPGLDIHHYPELIPWLSRYCVVSRTGGFVIYHACAEGRRLAQLFPVNGPSRQLGLIGNDTQ